MARFLTLLAIVLALQLGAPVQAAEKNAWQGFYSRSGPTPTAANLLPANVCLAAIQTAQARHGIPDNLLLAIGLQEAGRLVNGQLTIWPWTGNAEGRGGFFSSKQELRNWVDRQEAKGIRSIDIGCMQINQRWHARHFSSFDEAADPEQNADFAARFLLRHYRETGDWWEAAGRYHSSTPEVKARYLNRLSANHKLAQTHANSAAMATTDAVQTPVQQRPAIGWSAELSGALGNSRKSRTSIYSARPIEPLLTSPSQEP